jgi:hypothetical protein
MSACPSATRSSSAMRVSASVDDSSAAGTDGVSRCMTRGGAGSFAGAAGLFASRRSNSAILSSCADCRHQSTATSRTTRRTAVRSACGFIEKIASRDRRHITNVQSFGPERICATLRFANDGEADRKVRNSIIGWDESDRRESTAFPVGQSRTKIWEQSTFTKLFGFLS